MRKVATARFNQSQQILGCSRMSQRELAKLLGLSARQLGRLSVIPRRKDGTYDPQQAIPTLLRHYRQRLTIAESLCRQFMPGELEARYAAMEEEALVARPMAHQQAPKGEMITQAKNGVASAPTG
jgi:hypothetical protein